ncbi:Dihydropteroate synthase [Methyloligella halotolerans]|uniref:Dihydropteroate synthase n=1 Tax=Methyloligella halotolerans TaxID=1177755 RepID=A0A1E2RZQ4_9HYPH|nr:Dihydropteroate synthase [Methyloligella halotolerans]
MSRLYLRPLGFVYGPAAKTAQAEGFALPIAGGPVAFTLAEVIEGEPGSSKRRMVAANDLSQTKDRELYEAIGRVTAPREGIAGIPASRLCSGRPVLMGIVNVTPDSFSDGGLFDQKEPAVNHAAELIQAGAEIIDIGGESTRPGSETVPGEDELSRVVPVLEDLRGVQAVISVDTRKAAVARAAAEQGATIFNDVSALTYDPESLQTAVDTGMDLVLMHAQGEPKTMQKNPTYADVVLESTTTWQSVSPRSRRPASQRSGSLPIRESASARTSITIWSFWRIFRFFTGSACRFWSARRGSASSKA